MNKQLFIDSIGWGIGLWLIGYLLGIGFFFVLPPELIGWVVTPIGMGITLWVLLTRVKGPTFQDYVIVAVVWTVIAVAFDYLLIVRLFKPADGYYKPDVYLYYALTFASPLIVGWWRVTHARGALAE